MTSSPSLTPSNDDGYESVENDFLESTPFLCSQSLSSSSLAPPSLPPNTPSRFLPPARILLGILLSATLATFWLLDSIKDALLDLLTDGNLARHQPTAKMASVVGTVAVVALYERAVEASDVRGVGGGAAVVRLFYRVVCPYALAFLCLAEALRWYPAGTREDPSAAAPPDALRWKVLGYASFFLIESFCSLSIATFWMYTNTTMSVSEARKGYGTIVAVGQLGAIAGASLVSFGALGRYGYPAMFVWAFWGCVGILTVITFYDRAYRAPTDELKTTSSIKMPRRSVGGVRLILNDSYLQCILGISCLYEISLTVLDYLMKVVGVAQMTVPGSSDDAFASLMGHFGQLTNLLSFLLSSVSFTAIVQNAGLRCTLLIFPTALITFTVLAFARPVLWVLFISVAVLKALTYGIHEPAKEILYIPTSPEAKVRAKFWIDVVGARIAKAVGSSITAFSGNARRAQIYGCVPAMAAGIALWAVGWRVGKMFEDRVDKQKLRRKRNTGNEEHVTR